ncbi:hypothetical protein [Zooshikella harenae]|uniref:Uncharacterized protein n=1 Tax=Zooshikella harenae TaxID=2827238 RepID=A0ABS5ZFJ1_9GAMM|nr:hypothetical protein [Zooshikella harenae]MBU2712533.1 hypothetical protein [Zooshikella harenae]
MGRLAYYPWYCFCHCFYHSVICHGDRHRADYLRKKGQTADMTELTIRMNKLKQQIVECERKAREYEQQAREITVYQRFDNRRASLLKQKARAERRKAEQLKQEYAQLR